MPYVWNSGGALLFIDAVYIHIHTHIQMHTAQRRNFTPFPNWTLLMHRREAIIIFERLNTEQTELCSIIYMQYVRKRKNRKNTRLLMDQVATINFQ